MGTKSSSYYKSKMDEIEDKIAEEMDLVGVKRHENGEDQLDLENRLKGWQDLLIYYENEYEKDLDREGKESNVYFIGRMEYGN